MSEVVEQYTINHIPEDARYGKPRSLFPFWFSANTSVLTMLTGAIGIELGLSLWVTLVVLLIGGAVGGVFMAYHSAQGPKLGLPQMVQTRAQFGFFGSLIPSTIVMVIFLGFIVGENVIGAQALAGVFHISIDEAMAINGFVTWLVVYFGYRILHNINYIAAAVSFITIIVLFVRLVQRFQHIHYVAPHFSWPAFFIFFSICVSGQIGWAAYVSDYSRYLPVNSSVKKVFWFTYGGTVLGAFIGQIVGALAGVVALSAVNSDSVGFLAGLVPGADTLLVLVLFLSILAGNAINLYSPLVAGLACISPDGGKAPGSWVRGIGTALIMALSGWVATIVSANFLGDLTDFALLLVYFLMPWSAINLVDYYVVHKGKYDINSILSLRGRYGLFNIRTVVIFFVGIAAEIPFWNSTWPKFTGPIAHAFDGADFSWLVGFVVAAVLYYGASRIWGRQLSQADESDVETEVAPTRSLVGASLVAP